MVRFHRSSKRIGLFLCFLLVVTAAKATNWYVDNAVVGGGNNGTTWANAWTSFGSVSWSSIRPGDTLYVSGGTTSKTYTDVWSVGASGAYGLPITIKLDSTNSNHNGFVIFDYNSQGDTCTTSTAITCNQSYITFDGNVGGVAHLVVQNLRNQLNRYTGYCLNLSGTSNTVRFLATTNCNNPVTMSGLGATVNNCIFAQTRGDRCVLMGSAGSGFDACYVYSNVLECLFNTTVPPGGSGNYLGPDGVQCGNGCSIHDNKMVETRTSVYTSTQHPDWVQAIGNYIKFYNNEVINIGDSGWDYDCYANSNPHDIWIFNNVYHITTWIDPYPEYFRMYTSGAAVNSMSNVKIFNNTYDGCDGDQRVIWFDQFNGNPAASGIEIKNNIFYNCGTASSYDQVVHIGTSSAFTNGSFSLDYNVYYSTNSPLYIGYNGSTYTTTSWIASNEPHSKTTQPLFMSYVYRRAANDYRLQSTDTVAKDMGLSLSSYFSIDKNGVARPQGAAWDIGAYEYVAGGTPVIAVSPKIQTLGPIGVGNTMDSTFLVQNTGTGTLSGSVAASTPFSVISGSPYSIAAGGSQSVVVRYSPSTTGTNTQTVTFSGGLGASANITGIATNYVPIADGFVFQAAQGLITSPLVVGNTSSGSFIYQPVQTTTVSSAGTATYSFMVTNAGSYVLQALVNAPDTSANSFFVNIDAVPVDPTMIWDIPVTTGFEQRLVSWRGTGSDTNAQFAPIYFKLSSGQHTLVIAGREANAQIQSFTFLRSPDAPQNLRVIASY